MSQDNASFTFLHRIEEVELNIEDGRWQSALALALTLPDICGGIAFPEIVKRYRDGRAVLDRNQRPTRDVGNQYIRWFDTYAAPFFKVSAQDISPYICGERCWQLRCEYLHQNKGFANTEDNTSIRFHLAQEFYINSLDRSWRLICLPLKHRRKPNPQKPLFQQHKRVNRKRYWHRILQFTIWMEMKFIFRILSGNPLS